MARITSLCVYCGSSDHGDRRHREWTAELGREAARRAIRIVFGGGRVGLMGVVADATLAAGGEVIGIIPDVLQVREVSHDGLTQLEVVDSMHSRKARMCVLADAFCILPGGFGTLDEAFEIITWKQLRIHDKPIVLLNQGGYWQPLLDLVKHQVAEGYVRPHHAELFAVADTVAGVFDVIAEAPEPWRAGASGPPPERPESA
jgi:uncharacterized protein (TIGR00730 family)